MTHPKSSEDEGPGLFTEEDMAIALTIHALRLQAHRVAFDVTAMRNMVAQLNELAPGPEGIADKMDEWLAKVAKAFDRLTTAQKLEDAPMPDITGTVH